MAHPWTLIETPRLPVTSLLIVAALQLTTADITIDLTGATTVVEARYEWDEPFEFLTFNVIRLPRQAFRLIPGATSNTIEIDTLAGLYRVRLTSVTSLNRTAVIRYEVTGDTFRIPLAVPEIPTEPGVGRVTITIGGLSSHVALSDGFPRLERRTDDYATAELDNVPSFVRLPPNVGDWSVNKLAEITVIMLVALASLYWLLRRRRVLSHRTSGNSQ